MGGGTSRPQDSYAVHSSKDLITHTLKKLPFMQMMDSKLVEELAQCFHTVKYPKNAAIKTDARQFYVVAEGAVDISSLVPTSSKKNNVTELLCQRKVGDYISYAAREDMIARMMAELEPGEHANNKLERKKLIQILELNHTTADAFVGCTLLKLHHAHFQNLRAKYAVRKVELKNTARFSGGRQPGQGSATALTRPEKIHLFSSIVESDVATCLLDVPFLEIVEASRLLTLSNMCAYLYVRRGEQLCVEGEYGDRFFICVHGSIEVSINVVVNSGRSAFTSVSTESEQITYVTPLQQPIKKVKALKRLGPGAYFGEISLLLKIPRICSVTAVEDSLLVYIDRTSFCNFLKVVPEASAVLMEHVRFNFLDTLIKQGCSMLSAIPSSKLEELSMIGELVECEADMQIISRHEKHNPFFIVLTGNVELTYYGQSIHSEQATEIFLVNPGGYFGQESIMLVSLSTVSAKSTKHSLLLKLGPDAFRRYFTEVPEVYSEFCLRCLQDKARPEHVLQHYEASKLWTADCVGRRRYNEVSLFEHIEDYRWESDITESNHERALVIFLKFMSESSPLPVVLSIEAITAVETEIASARVDRDTFATVRDEVLLSMDDDSFEAFKQGPTFIEFLSSLHCPRFIHDSLTEEKIKFLSMSSKHAPGEMIIENTDRVVSIPKRAFGTFNGQDKSRRTIASAAGTNPGGNMLAMIGRQLTIRSNALAKSPEQWSRRKMRSNMSHTSSKSFLF